MAGLVLPGHPSNGPPNFWKRPQHRGRNYYHTILRSVEVPGSMATLGIWYENVGKY